MELRVMDKLTSLPGPRYISQGEGSGEEFRDTHLIPAFEQAVALGEVLVVNMDGAQYGYPTSFLEETFGGLARERGTALVEKTIRIKCTSEPMLIDEVMHYIRYGEQNKTPPFAPQGST